MPMMKLLLAGGLVALAAFSWTASTWASDLDPAAPLGTDRQADLIAAEHRGGGASGHHAAGPKPALHDNHFQRSDRRDVHQDRLDRRQDRFDVRRDRVDTRRDRFDARRDRVEVRRDRFDVRQDRFDLRRDRFDVRQDRFDVRRDRIDLREDRRAAVRPERVVRGDNRVRFAAPSVFVYPRPYRYPYPALVTYGYASYWSWSWDWPLLYSFTPGYGAEVPPAVVPPPAAAPETFPYDGGPSDPVPMPRAEPDPTAVPPAKPVPGGRVASLTKVSSPYVYRGYGVQASRPGTATDHVIPIQEAMAQRTAR
jgi:hypothetical protein